MVAENAERLREILIRLDRAIGYQRTIRAGNNIGAKYYEIVQRAAITRQREALDALVNLCETGHSAFAVCLLRPAYEELVWLEYLNKHSDIANDLLVKTVRHGIAESLKAQDEYLGRKEMRRLGFSMRFLKFHLANEQTLKMALRHLGSRLGWRNGAYSPSFAFLSRQVGREKEYSYIYHATSRFVHFSPHELVRRAWGNPTEVTIGSAHFVGYWSAFSLHWGLRIYINTCLACSELIGSKEEGPEIYEELEKLLSDYLPPVPIITNEELEWPWADAG